MQSTRGMWHLSPRIHETQLLESGMFYPGSDNGGMCAWISAGFNLLGGSDSLVLGKGIWDVTSLSYWGFLVTLVTLFTWFFHCQSGILYAWSSLWCIWPIIMYILSRYTQSSHAWGYETVACTGQAPQYITMTTLLSHQKLKRILYRVLQVGCQIADANLTLCFVVVTFTTTFCICNLTTNLQSAVCVTFAGLLAMLL